MSAIRDVTEVTMDDRTSAASTQLVGNTAIDERALTRVPHASIGQFPKSNSDELTLISLSQHGDSEAFARLYERYVDGIHRYVFFRVADQQSAEDITAHVFIKMWEKLPSYKIGNSPIGAWLYRIAHNAIIDHYRNRNRRAFVSLDDVTSREVHHHDGVDEKLDLQIKLEQLGRALQKLTEGQREVLILRFIEGSSIQEIGLKLGKSQGAVRALQMRGLQELAKSPSLQMESQSYD